MKRLFASTLLLTFCILSQAQNFSDDFNRVYQACLELRSASMTGSFSLMKSAATELKAVEPRYFSTLKCLDDAKLSLDGHFIFDYEFVDSLVVNKKVYSFAQTYSEKGANRYVSNNKKIFMKTCCVGAMSSSRYSFVSQKTQELAVVADGHGLINLRVYDKTNQIWYNDDQDLNTGLPSRTRVFDIGRGYAVLELEIINKTDKDISFVIISN